MLPRCTDAAALSYLETSVPRTHLLWFFATQQTLDVVHHIPRIVARYFGAPSGTHALGPVHKYHRHNWYVVAGLDRNAVVVEIVQDLVVIRMEDGPRDGAQVSVNVPGVEQGQRSGSVVMVCSRGGE